MHIILYTVNYSTHQNTKIHKLDCFKNAYGCELFCPRLRISSCTVTNFFLHGCGDARNRTK